MRWLSVWIVALFAAAALFAGSRPVAFAAPAQEAKSSSTSARKDTTVRAGRSAVSKPRPSPDRPPPPRRKGSANGPRKNIGVTVRVESPTTPPPLPLSFELPQNFPNPFSGSTAITFAAPRAAYISVVVYNVSGQKVATLAQGIRPAGWSAVRWYARDDQGKPCPPGLYFCRMDAGSFHRTRKLILR